MANANNPAIPHPSSTAVVVWVPCDADVDVGMGVDRDRGVAGCVQSALVENEEIHSANRGVIFHSTAPVVPPALEEESRVGDCWMV